MLPARSKRYAGLDARAPARLRLVAPWQLTLISALMGALLVMVFPRASLMERLSNHDVADELTLAYTQSFYRANPNDADLALLLARASLAQTDVAAMEQLILRWVQAGKPRQRHEARALLLATYQRALSLNPDPAQHVHARQGLIQLIRGALPDSPPPDLAQGLADAALSLGLTDEAMTLLDTLPGADTLQNLERRAHTALALGQYSSAATYWLRALPLAPDPAHARQTLLRAVDTLLAGNLYTQAAQVMQEHSPAYAHDRAMLRELIVRSRAAGDTALATQLARWLVFGA